MVNDDQLSRDLGTAFRAETDDLTYRGRVPTVRRSSAIVVPAVVAGVAGTAGVAAVVASAVSGSHPAHQAAGNITPTVSTRPTSTSSPTAQHHVPPTKLVRHQLRLAGYTLVYTAPAGAAPIYGELVSSVPADAEQLATTAPVEQWIGIDPSTGNNAAYVAASGGRILEVTSSDASRAELVSLLQSADPHAIPMIGASDG